MKPDYEELLRQAEQKRLLTEIGQGADTMWSRIAGFQPNNAMYQQQYAAANDPIGDSLGIDNSQRQAERLDLERQQYGDAMQQQAADAAAQSARQTMLDKRYEAEQLAKHGLEQDKLALDRARLGRLLARDSARGLGGGPKKLTSQEKIRESNREALSGITPEMIDQMDITPVQRGLAKAALQTGDAPTLAQIVGNEASIQSERAKPGVGGAGVADYEQIIKQADKLLAKSNKKGEIKGLGGDVLSRANQVDIPFDGGLAEEGIKTVANAFSGDEEKLNRQAFANLTSDVRKEKFGSSLTGSEKGEFRRLSGSLATASPSERVAFLKLIRDKARLELENMKKGRRNPNAPLAAETGAKTSGTVRVQQGNKVYTIPRSDLEEALADGAREVQ